MTKIFHWVFGSFFRTLGRILGYLIIGVILALILSNSKLPKISDIFTDIAFMRVNASTTYAFYTNEDFYSRGVKLTFNNYQEMYQSSNFFNSTDKFGTLHFGTNGLDLTSATDKPSSVIFTILVPFVEDNHNFNGNFNCTNTILHNTTSQPDGSYATNYYPSSTTCSFNGENWNEYNNSYTISAMLYSYNSNNGIGNWLTCHVDINGIMSEGAYNYFNLTCPVFDGANYISDLKIYSDNSYNSGLYISRYLTITKDNSDDTITSAISSQTNNIVSNQNQNTQSIINNQNQNNQAVINNQNANTNATIENQNQNTQATIDSQKVCNQIDSNNIITDNKILLANGSFADNSYYGVTDYIKIYNSELSIIKVFNYNVNSQICYYNIDKTLISCQSLANLTTLSIPNSAYYMKSTIFKSENKPTFKLCQNGNQAMANTITDESAPSNLSSISNDSLVGYLPPGPVDSLLNLPLVLLNSLQNALSSSCSPITLTLPFVNSDIILPCMSSLYEQMGVSSFVNWAGIVASAFILFSYLIRFYKWVDNTLTFRENNWLDNWGGE